MAMTMWIAEPREAKSGRNKSWSLGRLGHAFWRCGWFTMAAELRSTTNFGWLTHPICEPWCWDMESNMCPCPKSPSHVGKYTSTMEHIMGMLKPYKKSWESWDVFSHRFQLQDFASTVFQQQTMGIVDGNCVFLKKWDFSCDVYLYYGVMWGYRMSLYNWLEHQNKRALCRKKRGIFWLSFRHIRRIKAAFDVFCR